MRNTTRKSFASSPLARPNPAKGKPMRKLTKDQKRDARAVAAKRDDDIDFSDAPLVLDWSRAELGKFYRPTKRPVTMRLDSDIIEWLKVDGRGYQTKANALLRHAILYYTRKERVTGHDITVRRLSKDRRHKRKA